MESRRWGNGEVRRGRAGGARMRGGTLLGMALGILVGVLISFAVVWYLNRTPLPFVEKVSKQEVKPAEGAPKPLPGKPGDKPIDKPGERRFDFYEILEGRKEAGAPAGTPPAAAPATAPPPAPATAARFLQAGAFQQAGDAENLRARLALLGFEANVQAADVPEKGRVYRVRVGPYAQAEELNRAREALSQNGISTTVVKE